MEKGEQLYVLESYDSWVEEVAMSEHGSFFASQLERGKLLVFKAKEDGNGQKQNFVFFTNFVFVESIDLDLKIKEFLMSLWTVRLYNMISQNKRDVALLVLILPLVV